VVISLTPLYPTICSYSVAANHLAKNAGASIETFSFRAYESPLITRIYRSFGARHGLGVEQLKPFQKQAEAEAANAASALGGAPVMAVRVSQGDQRERHRGVSHHTRAVLDLAIGQVTVAWPSGLAAPDWLEQRDEVEVSGWQEACEELPLEHMGRGRDDDPWFFASAFAAGKLARGKLG
jgi:hypothetical protein